MSAPREIFLFFLADAVSGKTYFVDHAGSVQLTNEPTPLPQAPDGWLDSQVSFGRNTKYYAINRSYTNPLKFVGDGAKIIRKFLYTGKGVEASLNLIILKWDDATDIYQMYYKGGIDFSKAEDSYAETITVNLLETGLLQLVKTNESTTYEIPLDGSIPENFKVSLDGILLKDTFTYRAIDFNNATGTLAVPAVFSQNIGDNIGIQRGDENYEPITISMASYLAGSGNWIFSSAEPISVRIYGQITVFVVENHLVLSSQLAFFTSLNNHYDIINENIPTGKLRTATFDITFDLAADERLFLALIARGTWNIQESVFNIEFSSRYKTTDTWAITAEDAYKYLVSKVTGGAYPASSGLLAQYRHLAMTSGLALRNPPGAAGGLKAVLKTSLSDFFQSFNAILGAALGPEKTIAGPGEQLFFERKRYAYDPSVVTMNLGEVSKMKGTIAADYYASSIKIGYPEQTYDEKQGQQEYNTTAEYKTPVTRIVKAVELVSKYRADSYGVEYTRYLTPGNNTVNNKSDNDVFILAIDRTSPTADIYDAEKTTPETYNGSADIKFDTLSGNYITPNVDNTQFTYNGPSQQANIGIGFTSQKSDSSLERMIIYKNGVNIAQVDFVSNGSANGIGADVQIDPGDVIKATITYIGTGTTLVTVQAALLRFTYKNTLIYNLLREAYTAVSGVDTPSSAYNIKDLTPLRMLLKHADYLASTMFNLSPAMLEFQTSSKNQLLSTTYPSGITLTENANIPVSSLGNPLFYPFIFEFDTKVPLNFLDLADGAANGHIEWTFNGKIFYGFPLEVSAKPALNESQHWKVLCSPMTSLADLADLDIDGLNYLDLMGFQTSIPKVCPVQFVPLNLVVPLQYHFKHMDSDWFSEQIQFWASKKNYYQPWQTNDVIELQVITNGLGPVQAQLINGAGENQGAPIALAGIATSALAAPRLLFQGSVPLTGLTEDIYYLVLTAGSGGTVTQHISEPMWVKEDWPMTLLFEYSHSRNKQATIFTEGYNPSIRVGGWIDGFSPEARFVVYEDEPADLEMINGIPYRKFKLNLGIDDGLPDWVTDKISRIMLLNNVTIDGVAYTRDSDSKFEVVAPVGSAKKYWSLAIREAHNRDAVTLNTDGQLDENITVVYNIDTKGFGDGAGASNIVQVIKIDD